MEARVLRRLGKEGRKGDVNGVSYGVLSCRPVQLDLQDASGTFCNNVTHRLISRACRLQMPNGRDSTAGTQPINVVAGEAKLLEYLLVMLTNTRSSSRRCFRHAMHCDR